MLADAEQPDAQPAHDGDDHGDLDDLADAAEGDRRAEHDERDRVGDQVTERHVQERGDGDAEQPAHRARPHPPAIERRTGHEVDDLQRPHRPEHHGDDDEPGRQLGESRPFDVGRRSPDATFTAFMIAESRCFNVAMPTQSPHGVTTSLDDDAVSATAVVDAPPAEVFDFLRRPENHAVISGDESVRGNVSGPELLGPGSKFGMSMKVGVPYRVSSKVVEFERGPGDRLVPLRRASLALGARTGRREADPGDRDVRPVDGQGAVRAAGGRLSEAPSRRTSPTSVANVAAHFAAPSTAR